MADDDDDKFDGFDPWADLDDDAKSGGAEGFSLPFDEGSPDEPAADPVEPVAESADEPLVFGIEGGPVEDVVGAEGGFTHAASFAESPEGDSLVEAWLSEPVDAAGDPPLSVFPGDEPADDVDSGADAAAAVAWSGDPEAIEIGTGESAVTSASEIEAIGFESAAGEPTGRHPEPEFVGFGEPLPEGTAGEESEVGVEAGAESPFAESAEHGVIGFGTAAAMAAAAGTAASAAVVKATPAARPRKRSGIGQLIGIVTGGLLAIPIVLGILIGLMWMGWKDTVGIRGWMPQQLAFLLPPRTTGGGPGAAGAVDLSGGPSIDDLPSAESIAATSPPQPGPAPEPATEEPAASPPAVEEPAPADTASTTAAPMEEAATGLPASEEPAMRPDVGPATESESVASTGEPPAVSPVPSASDLAALDLATANPPMPSALDASAVVEPFAPPVPAVPEPEPLDTAALEAAVAEAAAGLDDLQAAVGVGDLARKRLLVGWYRSLVRVAEELSALEQVAADSGRPLASTPEAVTGLQDRILGADDLAADLASLGRDWLGFTRRKGDGVVLVASLAGGRRVGPYWCSQLVVAEDAAATSAREVVVISRAEPAAAAGEPVLVTGLAMDDRVIWASDIRPVASVRAAAAAPGDSDGFSIPAL